MAANTVCVIESYNPHVDEELAFHLMNSGSAMPASAIGPWEICSDPVITTSCTPVVGAYQVLTLHHRVLVYSGDSDGAVPYLGTIEWIEAFEGSKVPIKDWVAWGSRVNLLVMPLCTTTSMFSL